MKAGQGLVAMVFHGPGPPPHPHTHASQATFLTLEGAPPPETLVAAENGSQIILDDPKRASTKRGLRLEHHAYLGSLRQH
jgi:hypothetical protein